MQLSHILSLLNGLVVSIALLATVTVVGTCTGALLALGHLSTTLPLKLIATTVDLVLRGLPPIVLLLIVYYGFSGAFSLNSFWAATLALGVRAGGYFGHIFEGAVLAVPRSQVFAARSIGLGPFRSFLHVVLPQAYRHALPGIANEVSAQFKLTSLAFVVGVVELMRQARYLISAGSGGLLLILVTAAGLYYVANLAIFFALSSLEKRASLSTRRLSS